MPDNRTSIESLLASKGKPPREETASAKPADQSDDDYRAFSYGRIGRRAQMMVAFKQCSGQIEAYPYSMLSRFYTEDPGRGCELRFGAASVKIEGQGLAKLCQYLIEHRVAEITEADHAERFAEGGDGVVTKITVGDVQAWPIK